MSRGRLIALGSATVVLMNCTDNRLRPPADASDPGQMDATSDVSEADDVSQDLGHQQGDASGADDSTDVDLAEASSDDVADVRSERPPLDEFYFYCGDQLDLLRHGKRERLRQTEAPGGAPFDHGKFEVVEEPWPDAELARARAIVAGTEERLLEDV